MVFYPLRWWIITKTDMNSAQKISRKVGLFWYQKKLTTPDFGQKLMGCVNGELNIYSLTGEQVSGKYSDDIQCLWFSVEN